MNVDKKIIRKWVKELRSGKYAQTKDLLQDDKGFCCLGVACKTFISKKHLFIDQQFGYIHGELPNDQPNAPDWLQDIDGDFRDIIGVDLSDLNDGVRLENLVNLCRDNDALYNNNVVGKGSAMSFSFDEIADLIEAVFIHEVL